MNRYIEQLIEDSHLRYPFIKDLWDEYHVPLSFGENHIEFCDHEEGQCPFPGYCPNCEEVAAQMKFDEEHSKQHPSEEEDDIIFPFSVCKKTPTFSLFLQRILVIYTSKRLKFVAAKASNLTFSYQTLSFSFAELVNSVLAVTI